MGSMIISKENLVTIYFNLTFNQSQFHNNRKKLTRNKTITTITTFIIVMFLVMFNIWVLIFQCFRVINRLHILNGCKNIWIN